MPFPPPTTRHPVTLPDGSTYTGTVFLKTALSHPRIDVGDYTYYSDFEMPEAPGAIASRIAPYLFEGSPERLRIGKFCQIAHGTQFITASANHRYDGFSSYPFAIFDGMDRSRPSMPGAFPDTVVGHDCWFGHGATILPGARIGHGVIIGAGAVVGGVVEGYTVVVGNPARVVRHRVPREEAERLVALAWWDWPIEKILAHEAEICGANLLALEAAAQGLT